MSGRAYASVWRATLSHWPTQCVYLLTTPITPAGYKFRRWDGDLSGTIPAGVVTMSAPRVVTALLDPVPYIAPAGVSNAAGTTPLPGVAPGGIVSIFGVNLAVATLLAPDGMQIGRASCTGTAQLY